MAVLPVRPVGGVGARVPCLRVLSVNKSVFKTYGYAFPTFLTTLHFVCTFAGLAICAALGQGHCSSGAGGVYTDQRTSVISVRQSAGVSAALQPTSSLPFEERLLILSVCTCRLCVAARLLYVCVCRRVPDQACAHT